MKRTLVWSAGFVRAAKRLAKTQRRIVPAFEGALELLAKDAFHPQLETHKLSGRHEGSYACTVAYDLRIVFRIVKHKGTESVLLRMIGTHDEVY